MHTVINISKPATKWVQNGFLGKIVKLEAYASKALGNVPIILKKQVTYKKEIFKYVDQYPIAGSYKTVDKAYQFSNDGLILYANGTTPSFTSDVVNQYRNGYWDLSWEQINPANGDDSFRRWTLINFAYVKGVKTTVSTYTYDDYGTPYPEGGIWMPVIFADYPATLTLTSTDGGSVTLTLIDREIEVPDVYCYASTAKVVGWSEDVQPQNFTLATLSVGNDDSSSSSSASSVVASQTTPPFSLSVAPKDENDLPFFLGDGDEVSVDLAQRDANALCVLLYIET